MSRLLCLVGWLSISLVVASDLRAEEVVEVIDSKDVAETQASAEMSSADKQMASEIQYTPEIIEAYYAYREAVLRLHQYRFVDMPRQRQLLDNQVKQNEAAARVLRRRIRDYRPFLQVGRYSPVRTAAENDQLALQATEQEVRLLRNERINLTRYGWQEAQLQQLKVLHAAARVRQLVAAQASSTTH